MGVFELSNFAKGTIGVCEAIAELKDLEGKELPGVVAIANK